MGSGLFGPAVIPWIFGIFEPCGGTGVLDVSTARSRRLRRPFVNPVDEVSTHAPGPRGSGAFFAVLARAGHYSDNQLSSLPASGTPPVCTSFPSTDRPGVDMTPAIAMDF